MMSSLVSRVSAAFLAAAGVPLLFAADVLLPRIATGIPTDAGWVGQLLAAAWLSIAFYNWNTRHTILGGIYGRPAVLLNLGVYLISALALFKVSATLPFVRLGAVPFALLAVVYGVLLLRGPLERSAGR